MMCPSQRDISCHMLKALGYRAEAVASGEEAVAYTAEQAVDLLVLDMIMEPGMNGRQTYEKIIEQRPGQESHHRQRLCGKRRGQGHPATGRGASSSKNP